MSDYSLIAVVLFVIVAGAVMAFCQRQEQVMNVVKVSYIRNFPYWFVFAACVLLISVSLVSVANAGPKDPEWNPPSRYDHAYSGKLLLQKLPQVQMQKACQKLFAKYGLKDTTSFQQHGCAKAFPDRCIVVTIDKTYMGATPVAVLRHELGHCNGWSGDHEP